MSAVVDQSAIWDIPGRDEAAESRLQSELGIPALVAAILVRRGLGEPEAAEAFLNPSLDDLHDPKTLPDFEPAVSAILGAKERGELIYVHGDYDVDGVSSTAMMTRFLEKIGCRVAPHVPHRMREGYGIHPDAVQWAKDLGASLFLTCDCGISAHDQIQMIYGAGMKAVVTDHHEPKKTLPGAEAVVNPHRKDSEYPFPHLAGAGVVFKLLMGIADGMGVRDQFVRAYLDLAVLGTVADVMPLVGENRVITKFGLEQLAVTQKPGVRALMNVAELGPGKKLTARDIGFRIGPRINAVGRIDDAGVALDLFLTKDEAKAREWAKFLDDTNTQRRSDQDAMIAHAVERVEAEGLHRRMVMVLADKGWHPGIIGIVAGKLAERFLRPTFVIAMGEDGVGKGSARSVPCFHLAEAIETHMDLLEGGGGHAAAAGLSIREENLEVFAERLDAYAAGFLSWEDFRPVLSIDAEVRLDEADRLAAETLELMQPFGEANPEPLFVCRGVTLSSVRRMRSVEHANVTFSDGTRLAQGVAWRLADDLEPLTGQRVDVAFRLVIDEWNGTRNVRWSVVDCRLAG